MENHPTFSVPAKTQSLKQKPSRKISESQKPNVKGPPFLRHKRVFGTAQNPNIPLKEAPEKPKKKQPSDLLEKSAKPSKPTQSSPAVPPNSEAKKSPDKKCERAKKKSVCFQEKQIEKSGNISQGGRVLEPQTPVKSPAVVAKPRRSGTPYHSAEKCSKCRFDRLETSVYWISQIKMAESVGKHFVSASFFRLAHQSKAEPFRTLKAELKKYMARHEYLNMEFDWKNLSISYGLTKEESHAGEENDKVHLTEDNANVEGEKNLQKENIEETENTKN